MAIGNLTALQERVLLVLAEIRPAWTLTGGAALVGFHTLHRETRDLDLFFRGERTVGILAGAVREALERAGLAVSVLQTGTTLLRMDVRDDASSVILDLVADPTPIAEHPQRVDLGAVSILIDTPHQLLVNKLCALLSRSELRDLVDVRELVARGGDLTRALADCPKQDGGFSPLTFGWSVREFPVERLGAVYGMSAGDIEALVRFRDDLVARVVAEARPPE
ncbi:MAG TPA: nucleotidyl transferase AbiEii/AbiGii toxin family protein [Kofleriaceae bacterium]|jgi:hypothetical protein|nr:nucleotidyl transferase AbiEii/AbiGii toxin family protein [Kofleriaceae bacterium]